MLNNKVRNFDWLLNKGDLDSLVKTGQDVFIVDTGVFIDLEAAYNNDRRGRAHPASLIDQLRYPVIITEGVMEEIVVHREIRIGSRYELSQATSILVERLYEDSKDFFSNARIDEISQKIKDYHRYQVFLAGSYAFEKDSRKGEKERISHVDKEILSLALDLSLCDIDDRPIGFVNIMSPDEHICRTISFLKNLDYFRGYKIRAINTRKDLRSYMSK